MEADEETVKMYEIAIVTPSRGEQVVFVALTQEEFEGLERQRQEEGVIDSVLIKARALRWVEGHNPSLSDRIAAEQTFRQVYTSTHYRVADYVPDYSRADVEKIACSYAGFFHEEAVPLPWLKQLLRMHLIEDGKPAAEDASLDAAIAACTEGNDERFPELVRLRRGGADPVRFEDAPSPFRPRFETFMRTCFDKAEQKRNELKRRVLGQDKPGVASWYIPPADVAEANSRSVPEITVTRLSGGTFRMDFNKDFSWQEKALRYFFEKTMKSFTPRGFQLIHRHLDYVSEFIPYRELIAAAREAIDPADESRVAIEARFRVEMAEIKMAARRGYASSVRDLSLKLYKEIEVYRKTQNDPLAFDDVYQEAGKMYDAFL